MRPRLYAHRINTVEQLEQLPRGLGLELDLRSEGDRVIVTHDPFTKGPTIDEYFPRIGARACIFDVKCEGIEDAVLRAAARYGITDFFMLNLTVPAAWKLARSGEHRLAVRYSEVEPVEQVLAWKGLANWVWVDCFTRYPTAAPSWAAVAASFQTCLVSPELQGHSELADSELRRSMAGLAFDAVCTKRPETWAATPARE
jgi:hypothetical protein